MTDSERAMDNRLREVEVKLGRVEQRVEDHEGDIHRFASLPTELEKVRWVQDRMGESQDAAHAAIRELDARLDREREERIAGQQQRKRELEEAQAQRSEEIARRDEAAEARFMELQARADAQKLENRRMLIGLLGIFLTSAAAVLAPLLGGGGA